jgi:hypothetical protein
MAGGQYIITSDNKVFLGAHESRGSGITIPLEDFITVFEEIKAKNAVLLEERNNNN